MQGGMVGTGRMYGESALDSMRRYSSQVERQKAEAEALEMQMDAAEQQQTMQMISTGVSTAAMAAMAIASLI